MAAANLKAQDVLVALKLAAHPGRQWQQKDLAAELDVSASEVSEGIRRLSRSRLFNAPAKRISREALCEFLVHGLKYVFPAEAGGLTHGTPTAWSTSPLRSRLLSTSNIVWPEQQGDVEGRALSPLHRSAPQAARRDPALYELLALVDAIRAGRARERDLAVQELRKRLC